MPDDLLLDKIATDLALLGMTVTGVYPVTDQDRTFVGAKARWLILIGNHASHMWHAFQADHPDLSQDNPLDTWTRDKIDALAAKHHLRAIYPFDGPPYLPFISWSKRDSSLQQSPFGPLFHPRFGLWHALRGGLICDHDVTPALKEQAKPPFGCDNCLDQPCLNACPVEALGQGRYDVPACLNHLKSEQNKTDLASDHSCFDQGCRARHACPVGQDYAYEPDHAHFHMVQFVKNIDKLSP